MKLTELEASVTKRVAILGLSGAGKTTLAAELAKEFNLKWIDIENALDTLVKFPREVKENIEVFKLPDSAAYPIAADTLVTLFKTGKMNVCQSHGKHECQLCKKAGEHFDLLDLTQLTSRDIVVLDSGTQLGHSILAHLTRGKPTDYKPERDDWGGLRKFCEFFCSQWQALNCNFVCIFHCIETTLEDGRVKLVPSFGSAPMSAEIAKSFGHAVYIETKNKKHCAYSSSIALNNVLTKSRTDFLIESLETPSLLPLFRQGQVTENEVIQATNILVKEIQDATVAAVDKPITEADTTVTTVAQQSGQTPAQTALSRLAALRKGQSK